MLFLKLSVFCRGLQLLNRTGISARNLTTTQTLHLIGMPPVGISRSYLELERLPKKIILSGHFVDIDQCREVLSQNLGAVMQIRHVSDTFIGNTGQLQIDLDSLEDKALPAWAIRSIHVPIISQLTGELGWHLVSTFSILSYGSEDDAASLASSEAEEAPVETAGENPPRDTPPGQAAKSSQRERSTVVRYLPEKKYSVTTETQTGCGSAPPAKRNLSYATRHDPRTIVPSKPTRRVKLTGHSGETLRELKPLYSNCSGTEEQSLRGQSVCSVAETSTMECSSTDRHEPSEAGPGGRESSDLEALKRREQQKTDERPDKALNNKESAKTDDAIMATVYCFERISSIKSGNADNIASQGLKALQLVIS